MKLSVPNVLSLLRIPVGIAVGVTGVLHAWDWAFALYLCGCATDVLDGFVAEHWHCGSDFGANVLEPVCDLALTVGALAALVLSHHLAWSLLIPMAVLYLAVEVICLRYTSTKLFTQFAQWFVPCYYLVVTGALVLVFAHLALSRGDFGSFAIVATCVAVILISYKRERFADWFSGLSF